MGVDLDQHIQFVIDAMRRAADAIGLAGTPAAASDTPAGAREGEAAL
jgi:hypothetical protein